MKKITLVCALVACLLVVAIRANAATVFPFTAALDPGISNAWDIFNPNHPGEVLEILKASFVSLTDQNQVSYPGHLILNAPDGLSPGSIVTADFFYDGPADSFPKSAQFRSHLDFTTDGVTHGVTALASSSNSTGKSYTSTVVTRFNNNTLIVQHNFTSTIGDAQTNLTLVTPFIQPPTPGTSWDFYYTINNTCCYQSTRASHCCTLRCELAECPSPAASSSPRSASPAWLSTAGESDDRKTLDFR